MRCAGDDVAAAQRAAGVVARRLGLDRAGGHGDGELLHHGNNVVVRFGGVVLKVGAEGTLGIEREACIAAELHAFGAPVLTPVADVLTTAGHVVSAWPYVEQVDGAAPEADVAAALQAFHQAAAALTTPVETLHHTVERAAAVAADEAATAALAPDGRRVLQTVLDDGLRMTGTDAHGAVVHGEPHDGNVLTTSEGVVLVDLESVKRAPVEWDMAFRPDEAAAHWPAHDPDLLGRLRRLVSAVVSVYCWRHATVRPHDAHARWHAEHHLGVLTRGDRQCR